MQNPRRIFVFGCVLKPKAIEDQYKTETGPFVLVNKCILGTNVFILIEMLSNKWWEQKLGTGYDAKSCLKSHLVFLIDIKWYVSILLRTYHRDQILKKEYKTCF